MIVIFSKGFKKDLSKLKDFKLKQKLKSVILELESQNNLTEITNLKKMKGYSTAYRIRVGDYRLGFYCDENCVTLARFVKRNDIYRLFP